MATMQSPVMTTDQNDWPKAPLGQCKSDNFTVVGGVNVSITVKKIAWMTRFFAQTTVQTTNNSLISFGSDSSDANCNVRLW